MSYTPKIRLFCPHPLSEQVTIPLDSKQSHYLQHVMRQKNGDSILVFNGTDGEWLADIDNLSKKSGAASAQKQIRPQHNEPALCLAFAPVKNAALHFLAQKATELGVSSLQPVITDHTIVNKVNTDKLYTNAIEASEQSERLTVPTIHSPQKLDSFLTTRSPNHILIFCDESGRGQPMMKALSVLPKHTNITILIGPEGGFSTRELEILHQQPHIAAVGLGPRILRADTAALAAIACYQACCGDGDIAPRFS